MLLQNFIRNEKFPPSVTYMLVLRESMIKEIDEHQINQVHEPWLVDKNCQFNYARIFLEVVEFRPIAKFIKSCSFKFSKGGF